MAKDQTEQELRQVALYVVTEDPDHGCLWVDIPEAKPRARARKRDRRFNDQPVIVNEDGSLKYDEQAVEIDRYEDPKYADIRREDEERNG